MDSLTCLAVARYFLDGVSSDLTFSKLKWLVDSLVVFSLDDEIKC